MEATMSETKITATPGVPEIRVERTFNAPRDLVFNVMTSAEHLPNWWGPASLKTTIDKFEARFGGVYRIIHSDANGEYAFHGVYHKVTPEMTVLTFEFEGMPGHVMLETITLEEKNGKTIWRQQSLFQSVEDRDGMVASGMDDGTRESMDRLAVIVEK